MKKLILSTTFLIAGTFSILAQGQVDFFNDPSEAWPDSIDRYVYVDSVGGTRVTDNTWTARLFENGTQLGDPIAFLGTIPGFEGIYEGIFPNDGVKRVVSVLQGVATTLEVRVFNGQGVFVGASAPFSYTMGSSIPPAPGDTLMIGFRAFAVPEPSTVALGVLGLSALLLFRRRK